jgi:hypothetical protein
MVLQAADGPPAEAATRTEKPVDELMAADVVVIAASMIIFAPQSSAGHGPRKLPTIAQSAADI